MTGLTAIFMWWMATSYGADSHDAAVMLTYGDVHVVTPKSSERVARVGDLLERDESVRTASDSAAILILSNNYLVRIDADLQLRVSDIVLLRASPTTRPIKDQLQDLIYPDEREALPQLDHAERVTGWQARPTAATTVPPRPFPSSGTPSPETVSAGTKKLRSEATTRDSVWTPLRLEAWTTSDAGRACLERWWSTLPVAVSEIALTVRPVDGTVRRVVMSQGLPLPACVRDAWLDLPVDFDGQATIRVSKP